MKCHGVNLRKEVMGDWKWFKGCAGNSPKRWTKAVLRIDKTLIGLSQVGMMSLWQKQKRIGNITAFGTSLYHHEMRLAQSEVIFSLQQYSTHHQKCSPFYCLMDMLNQSRATMRMMRWWKFMQCGDKCVPCIRCNFRRTLQATGLGHMPQMYSDVATARRGFERQTPNHFDFYISLISFSCILRYLKTICTWSTHTLHLWGKMFFVLNSGKLAQIKWWLLIYKIQYIPLLVVSTGQAAAKFTAGLTM